MLLWVEQLTGVALDALYSVYSDNPMVCEIFSHWDAFSAPASDPRLIFLSAEFRIGLMARLTVGLKCNPTFSPGELLDILKFLTLSTPSLGDDPIGHQVF